MTTTIKAQIILKQEQQETALSSVHVTSSNAHDVKYRVECPVYTKFEESPSDVLQSVSYESKQFVYSTEKKKKTATEPSSLSIEPSFILKVDTASKEWCPIRIRCDSEAMEGEVMFARPHISLDGNIKMIYSAVLFMNPSSGNLQERMEHQKEKYRNTSWMGIDLKLLIERRNKLQELCRNLEMQGFVFDNENDGDSDEIPVL